MSENKDNILVSGFNQKSTLTFPEIEASAVETIKNSPLYKNAATNVSKISDFLLTSTVTTNGWDTVSICRVTALNERIKIEKTYPDSLDENEENYSLNGKFDAWKIVTGGDGRNIKLRLPLKEGTFSTGQKNIDISGISVDIYVKLNYFPLPEAGTASDGKYELLIKTNSDDVYDPIASVISLSDPANVLSPIQRSIVKSLFDKWLNRPENLKKFDTLFATVLINNLGPDSEEFKWLRATAISYAYTDKNTEDSSIFGILCMTNNRSYDGLPNQLPAVSLEDDNNAIFLISREVFVKYQFLAALPDIFTETTASDYTLDEAGTTINAKNIKIDPVKVGAINYEPKLQTFEVTFDETLIRSTVKVHTNISPGIDAYTLIITEQTLVLGTNSEGKQIMMYSTVGDPIVQNNTEIAAWIIITEAILGIIAAVVTGVAGKIAGKVAALIVGIIVAAVVAIISIVIHVIIVEAIAGGVQDKIPSVSPMVKVASNQVRWPFCEPDAFVLSDINYIGALVFVGSLKLNEKYTIINHRLAAIA